MQRPSRSPCPLEPGRPLLLLTLAAVFCSVPADAARAALELARRGEARYAIVTAANPMPPEDVAAEELKTYLDRATGARFPPMPIFNAGDGFSRRL